MDNSTIIWGLIGMIISFISSIAFFGEIKKETILKSIPLTILGTVMSLILCFTYNASQNREKLLVIADELNDLKIYSKTANMDFSCYKAQNKEYGPIYNLLAEYFIEQSQQKCKELYEGTINLSPSETKIAWITLIKNAKKEVLATNTIAPRDWPDDACKLQSDCKAKISRIMIHRENDTLFNNKLEELANRQMRECKVQKVKWIFKNELYNSEKEFFTIVQKLQVIDLVVVDDEILLLTNYDEQDKNIVNSVITTDKTKIQLAKKLFTLMWNKSNNYK